MPEQKMFQESGIRQSLLKVFDLLFYVNFN